MATWIVAAAAVAQVALLAVAAVFAKGQTDEARSARVNQTRPFVVIDFHVESNLIYLEVANTGHSIAYNVRIEFVPELSSTFDSRRSGTPPFRELTLFAEGVASLVPGKRIRTIFDTFAERVESDLPDTYGVLVAYDGWPDSHYEELSTLDLAIYRNLLETNRRGQHDIHERLKELRDELRKWSATGGGLLRVSPEEQRGRLEQWHQEHEEREAASREAESTPQQEGRGGEPNA